MSYRLIILRRAQRQLRDVPRGAYPRIKEAIAGLAREPRSRNCAKLRSRDGWRLRVGDYRVVYEIDDQAQVVTVTYVAHRRDVYRDFG